jgi:hypothetical protein
MATSQKMDNFPMIGVLGDIYPSGLWVRRFPLRQFIPIQLALLGLVAKPTIRSNGSSLL